VPRQIVEDAVRAACAVHSAGEWSFVALESPEARRRVLTASGADGVLRAASILIVVCVRATSDSSEDAILLSVGAAIRGLTVALHSQRVGWSWDPNMPFDADGARAALALGEDWRPLGIVAVGRMPEGGASRPRPSVDPAAVLDWRG